MFKAIISQDYSVTANTNIPFTVIKHTNGDISYDNLTNTIIFNTPGYYNIDFHIVTTDVAGTDTQITVSELLNNVSSDNVVAIGVSSSTTDFNTFDLPDVLCINATYSSEKAKLSFQSDVACTSTCGYINIYKIGR